MMTERIKKLAVMIANGRRDSCLRSATPPYTKEEIRAAEQLASTMKALLPDEVDTLGSHGILGTAPWPKDWL